MANNPRPSGGSTSEREMRGLGLLATTSNHRAGFGGIDSHVGGLLPFALTLTRPLPRLPRLASGEEPRRRARAVEDFKNKRKHTLFDFGERQSTSERDELEGTAHQVRVALGDELNPSDGRIRLEALSRHNKRNEPVLVKEPASMESPETKFLHRGRGMLSCRSRGGRWGDWGRHGLQP